jgi:hypothetical protein
MKLSQKNLSCLGYMKKKKSRLIVFRNKEVIKDFYCMFTVHPSLLGTQVNGKISCLSPMGHSLNWLKAVVFISFSAQ